MSRYPQRRDHRRPQEQDRPGLGRFLVRGISNPLEVIEQITYLLFIRRLDELQMLKENKARRLGKPLVDPTFLPGQQDLRRSIFKNLDPGQMFNLIESGGRRDPVLQADGRARGGGRGAAVAVTCLPHSVGRDGRGHSYGSGSPPLG